MSRTPAYKAKRFLRDTIEGALDDLGIDPETAVTVVGRYGEKGAVFFPQTEGTDPHNADQLDGNAVGFMIVSRNEPGKHLNLSEAAAADLVSLLVAAYGFSVMTDQVPVTTYETRVTVSRG